MGLNYDLWWKLFRSHPAQFHTSTIETAVMKALKYYELPYYVDLDGNIFNVDYVDRPLLNAHMDSVQKYMTFPSDMKFNRDLKLGHIFKGKLCLGADDKVGLYIAINYLKDNPKTNFLFTQGEESGMHGVKNFCNRTSRILSNATFVITLDRRGAHDILCAQHKYGTQEFEDALVNVSATGEHGFKPTRGSACDSDVLKEYLSCANLSVGYYGAHTEQEYVVMKEVFGTEKFLKDICKTIGSTSFKAVKPEPYKYTNYQEKWAKQQEARLKKEKERKKKDADDKLVVYTKPQTKEIVDVRKGIKGKPKESPTEDELLKALESDLVYIDGTYYHLPAEATWLLKGFEDEIYKYGDNALELKAYINESFSGDNPPSGKQRAVDS